MGEDALVESYLVLSGEHRKLADAADVVYREFMNVSVGSVHPHVEKAIRQMVAVMEASGAPGRRKVHRLAKVS